MSTGIMSTALWVFVRPPITGHAKTRLTPRLGADGAARLYAAFLHDTLRTSCQPGFEVTLCVAGEPEHASLAALQRRHKVRTLAQGPGDLGAKLDAAFRRALSHHEHVLIVGSDAPTLPRSYLRAARDALCRAPVVLGPCLDGGYYVIGARHALPSLGPVRWSSPHTLRDTVRVCTKAGLEVALLAPWYDVDTPSDLDLLRLHLRLKPGAAPATARELRLRL